MTVRSVESDYDPAIRPTAHTKVLKIREDLWICETVEPQCPPGLVASALSTVRFEVFEPKNVFCSPSSEVGRNCRFILAYRS